MPARRIVPIALIGLAGAAIVTALVLDGARGRAVRPEDHIAALRREAASTKDPKALLVLGERLRRAGEGEAALDAVSRAYEGHFKEPPYSAALAEILIETGRLQDGLTI